MAFSWKLYGDGKTPPLGEAVAPDERLSWPLTIGIGAQHVVAMFGATFVFPLVMGLDPNLAIMMSGIATIIFLLIVNGKIPSYLGTSASFVGGVVAIRAQGGDSSDVVGSILIAGVVLALVGVLIHFAGVRFLHAVLPPAVTGAVVLLIGFNLAPVVAGIYWPQDQWVGAGDDDLRHRRLAAAARLLGPHRHPARPDLRLRALVAARRHGRPDHLGARRRDGGDDPRPPEPLRRGRRRTGSGCPTSPPRSFSLNFACSCCPPSSRWSRRTPGTSRRSRR